MAVRAGGGRDWPRGGRGHAARVARARQRGQQQKSGDEGGGDCAAARAAAARRGAQRQPAPIRWQEGRAVVECSGGTGGAGREGEGGEDEDDEHAQDCLNSTLQVAHRSELVCDHEGGSREGST